MKLEIQKYRVTEGELVFLTDFTLELSREERRLWDAYGVPDIQELFFAKEVAVLRQSGRVTRQYSDPRVALAFRERVKEACRRTVEYWDVAHDDEGEVHTFPEPEN